MSQRSSWRSPASSRRGAIASCPRHRAGGGQGRSSAQADCDCPRCLRSVALLAGAVHRHPGDLRAVCRAGGRRSNGAPRALGANPVTMAADGLIGILGADCARIAAGRRGRGGSLPAVAAGTGAVGLPDTGISADWTVLGFGLLVLIGGLSVIAAWLAYRGAPHRVGQREPTRRAHRFEGRPGSLAAAGLPGSGVVGVRMALEPGGGRTAVPVRSALLGTALAVALVVATVIFGSSLQTLVSHPPSTVELELHAEPGRLGGGNVPPQAFALLAHDPDVSAYTGLSYNDGEIDGQGVPFLFGDTPCGVTPPILSGHAVDKGNQIVLGGATMAAAAQAPGRYRHGSRTAARKDAADLRPAHQARDCGDGHPAGRGIRQCVSDHTRWEPEPFSPMAVLPAAFRKAMDSPDPTLNGPNLALVQDALRCLTRGRSGQLCSGSPMQPTRRLPRSPTARAAGIPSTWSGSNARRRSSTTAPSGPRPPCSSRASRSGR